jgi:hypothetical protein
MAEMGKVPIHQNDRIGVAMLPYAEDGVDVTLIQWMLSLTPAQRLEVLQNWVDEIEGIRAYRARHEVSGDPADPVETSG